MVKFLSKSPSLVNYLIILLLPLILNACYAGKKARVKKLIAATKEVLTKEESENAKTEALKSVKLLEENIDTSVGNRISEKLLSYLKKQESVKSTIKTLEPMLGKGPHFRRNYKLIVVPSTKSLNTFNTGTTARVVRYTMIQDGLQIAEKKLFPLGAFFGPGKYIIPEDKIPQAGLLFTPIVDSLILFSNKYDSIKQNGYLIVNGFADGTGFSPGPLYNTLLEALKKTSAEKAELNMQLSQFRANSISNLLNDLINTRTGEFSSRSAFRIKMYDYGQGETYPTKKITDYTDNDERRRVVILYWAILPED